MCKGCGCMRNRDRQEKAEIKSDEHSHGSKTHSHPPAGDHEHDPATGKIVPKDKK